MSKENPIGLNELVKNGKKYDVVDTSKMTLKTKTEARNEKAAEEAKEKAQIEQNRVLALVDERIERLKEENLEFNRLKAEAEEEYKRKQLGLLKDSESDDDYNNLEIEVPLYDEEDEGELNLEVERLEIEEEKDYYVNTDNINNNEIIYKIELNDNKEEENMTENNIPSGIETKIADEDNELIIVEEETSKEEDIVIAQPAESHIPNFEAAKIEKHIPEEKISKEAITLKGSFDEKDFEELNESKEDEKDYIDIGDEEDNNEVDALGIVRNATVLDKKYSKEELEDLYKTMQSELKEILTPVGIITSLANFKKGKSITASNATSSTAKSTFEHVLWNSGKPVAYREIQGFDLNELCKPIEEGHEYKQLLAKYQILYDHIISKKHSDVFQWLKSTRADDEDHHYMAAYGASFKDVNIMAVQCDNCDAPYIMKKIDINNMMKFKDDKAKDKFFNILNNPDDTLASIKGKSYPISRDYIFTIKAPSIWKKKLEPLLLEPSFREKYKSFIDIIMYVDKIYKIDYEAQEYRLIDYESDIKKNKGDSTSITRAILKNKIKKYGTIIKDELKTTEFQYLWSKIYKESFSEDEDGLQYCIPERQCSHCNHIDPEEILSGEALLFTRHQLDQLASI